MLYTYYNCISTSRDSDCDTNEMIIESLSEVQEKFREALEANKSDKDILDNNINSLRVNFIMDELRVDEQSGKIICTWNVYIFSENNLGLSEDFRILPQFILSRYWKVFTSMYGTNKSKMKIPFEYEVNEYSVIWIEYSRLGKQYCDVNTMLHFCIKEKKLYDIQ